MASVLPYRGPPRISAWPRQRRWSIRGTGPFQGAALVEGGTGDLAAVAGTARAWHDGAALDDIRRVAPFVHLTGRFEVPDHDPVYPFTSHWALRFSTITRPRLTAVGPCLAANSDGTYGVSDGVAGPGPFRTPARTHICGVRYCRPV
ncbi:hypothetical protein IQ279_25605 [Streptomyces verrucosisporus]|uniref:DUF6193 family natural product biosynthesis protein n=1 Tax=Streptomyces verrucosisporus TaxID=1695161 RepID=UPI0019D0D20F|nr:DUF6193 family natural product biosynthesis protein [Streptomyces verrucosisporus]MBN3932941.1 hypothetical protein [Streptomyces verrucosisporus]